MINGLGVVGWGVGGIEAEAALLGQPLYQPMPIVVGFRLDGEMPAGSTATDLVLTVTEMLRAHGVVGKFVEFHGPGMSRSGPGGSRHHQQHVAGVRRHRDPVPGRRRDAALPAHDRPSGGARWRVSRRTPRSRACSGPMTPRSLASTSRSAWTWAAWCRPLPDRVAHRIACRSPGWWRTSAAPSRPASTPTLTDRLTTTPSRLPSSRRWSTRHPRSRSRRATRRHTRSAPRRLGAGTGPGSRAGSRTAHQPRLDPLPARWTWIWATSRSSCARARW